MSGRSSLATLAGQFVADPGGRLAGEVRVPGDKSISHRAVMLGAVATGTTRIDGFLEGADALATRNALRALGVSIRGPGQAGRVEVDGVGLDGLRAPASALDCGNAGTAMRLFSGLLSGCRVPATLTGDASLSRRPMRRVIEPLARMGARIDSRDGLPPLVLVPGRRLAAIDFAMPVASAQVKSAVLLAGLSASGTTRVTEPAPTRDHTERMLAAFGVTVAPRRRDRRGRRAAAALRATAIDVPADLSSAAFFLVAASIAEGSDLLLRHVGINPTRAGILEILRAMGADIAVVGARTIGGEPVADLRVRSAALKGIEVAPEWVPLAIDEFPVLFVAAACAEGTTVVTGAEELRVKESDRIQAMADGLAARRSRRHAHGRRHADRRSRRGGDLFRRRSRRFATATTGSRWRSPWPRCAPRRRSGSPTSPTSRPRSPALRRSRAGRACAYGPRRDGRALKCRRSRRASGRDRSRTSGRDAKVARSRRRPCWPSTGRPPPAREPSPPGSPRRSAGTISTAAPSIGSWRSWPCERSLDLDDVGGLVAVADGARPAVRRRPDPVGGRDVTEAIRAEPVGNAASRIAALGRFAGRWSRCSTAFGGRRAWSPTAATWGR